VTIKKFEEYKGLKRINERNLLAILWCKSSDKIIKNLMQNSTTG
jgi:hypothetical protein